ncbi:MAG TPA: D-alanyl-D-alanine carboxypeptidase/D-alanyl-D-alanine-endopeptidase [Tepidisphaeraceae bacterium]
MGLGFALLGLVVASGCKPIAEARPAPSPSLSNQPHRRTDLQKLFAAQPSQSKAIYGFRIIDADSGVEIYSHNPDLPVMPASNMKVFTAATSLDAFGPDDPLKTTLAYDGKNLWIIGGGDPSVGDPTMAKAAHHPLTQIFDQWAADLKAKGLSHIHGNIYYDDRLFDHQLTSPTWGHYLGEWYSAPVTALNFNDNCIDTTLFPTKSGEPMRPEIMPPTDDVQLINHTHTQHKNNADVHRDGMRNVYILTGGGNRKLVLDPKPVIDPSAFFAAAMRTNFSSHGITITGSNEAAPATMPHLQIIAVHETRLADAIRRMDKDSQNLFAEAFSKRVGHWYAIHNLHQNLPGSWELGAQAVRSFLSRNGIDTANFHMVDGSGLSSQDRITARQMTALLMVMHHHSARQAFFDSLPISGTDGTIKKRMKSVTGKVHAKTGFINGVRSLSGYVQTNSGHTLIFSIIYNHIPGSVKPYEAIQDRVCEALVQEY